VLRRLDGALDGASAANMVGRRCFEALHRRQRPCEGCPALQTDGTAGRTTVVPSGFGDSPFAIVSAESASDNSRRMSALFIRRAIAVAFTRARITALAESAGLSQREREVLQLLVLGRSAREMGQALGISERTIKFHQTNLLEKLGAESRLDIFRLFY
jgi:DNA-binding CsgD family transcriptional regulator